MAILLGGTRSIWLATVPAVLYLVWFWRPKMMFAAAGNSGRAGLSGFTACYARAPGIACPAAGPNVDSNEHRDGDVSDRLANDRGPSRCSASAPRRLPGISTAMYPQTSRDRCRSVTTGICTTFTCNTRPNAGIPGLACILWFIGLTLYDCVQGILAAAAPGLRNATSSFHTPWNGRRCHRSTSWRIVRIQLGR